MANVSKILYKNYTEKLTLLKGFYKASKEVSIEKLINYLIYIDFEKKC